MSGESTDVRISDGGDDEQARLIGSVIHGKRYRLVVETSAGVRTGVVRAEVAPPKIEFIPGRVTFVLDGASLNENGLYPGPAGKIIKLEPLS